MDAVIVWSDTGEKEYRGKRLEYLDEIPGIQEVAWPGRGADELKLCLASVIVNLRFVGQIVIVTEKEPVFLDRFISENFPDWKGRIRIVTHDGLFTGLEGFLPCFSAVAIRTLLYRVRGLGDDFILVNPGCIPVKNVETEEFIDCGDIPIVYGSWKKSRRIGAGRALELFTGEEELYTGNIHSEAKKVFIPSALPLVIKKRQMVECLEASEGLIKANVSKRFNDKSQKDIAYLMANSDRIKCREIPLETVTLPSWQGNDIGRVLKEMPGAKFIRYSPLSRFPAERKLAIRDCLRAMLRIGFWI